MARLNGVDYPTRTYPKSISIDLLGGPEIVANLRKWVEDIAPDKVAKAIKEEMIDLMEESKQECPYDVTNNHEKDDHGHLRDTAKVIQDVSQDQVITYGSYDTPYAIYVHEILEYHHLPPTKAKFLEDPVNRREKVWMTNITERIGDFYEDLIKNRQKYIYRRQTGEEYGRFSGGAPELPYYNNEMPEVPE